MIYRLRTTTLEGNKPFDPWTLNFYPGSRHGEFLLFKPPVYSALLCQLLQTNAASTVIQFTNRRFWRKLTGVCSRRLIFLFNSVNLTSTCLLASNKYFKNSSFDEPTLYLIHTRVFIVFMYQKWPTNGTFSWIHWITEQTQLHTPCSEPGRH